MPLTPENLALRNMVQAIEKAFRSCPRIALQRVFGYITKAEMHAQRNEDHALDRTSMANAWRAATDPEVGNVDAKCTHNRRGEFTGYWVP